MRNKENPKVRNEHTIPKNLDSDRTYVLSYVYNGDFANQKTMAFSGAEIQKALNTLPPALLEGEFAESLKETIHTNIVVGGRLLLNKPLSNEHPEQTVDMMKSANSGCEDAMKLVRFGFAVYLGLNLDEIRENDSLMPETEENLLFVFDNDYSEMSFDEHTLRKLSQYSNCPETIKVQMKGVQS